MPFRLKNAVDSVQEFYSQNWLFLKYPYGFTIFVILIRLSTMVPWVIPKNIGPFGALSMLALALIALLSATTALLIFTFQCLKDWNEALGE